jgi:hypothetical protein
MPSCQHDGMDQVDEVKLTVRLSPADRRALKLHAVSQGRSVQGLVIELIRAELAKGAPPASSMSREEFVAGLYARHGIDPTSPNHQEIEQRARASVREETTSAPADRRDGGTRGAA